MHWLNCISPIEPKAQEVVPLKITTSYLSFYCCWFIEPFSNNEVRFTKFDLRFRSISLSSFEPHSHQIHTSRFRLCSLSVLCVKEFSRIVCVSLFSYQGSLFSVSQTAHLLYHMHSSLSRTFFKFFRLSSSLKTQTEKEGFEPSRRC